MGDRRGCGRHKGWICREDGGGEAKRDVKTWRSTRVHMHQAGRQADRTDTCWPDDKDWAGTKGKLGKERSHLQKLLSKGQGTRYSLTGEVSLTRLPLVKEDKRGSWI